MDDKGDVRLDDLFLLCWRRIQEADVERRALPFLTPLREVQYEDDGDTSQTGQQKSLLMFTTLKDYSINEFLRSTQMSTLSQFVSQASTT